MSFGGRHQRHQTREKFYRLMSNGTGNGLFLNARAWSDLLVFDEYLQLHNVTRNDVS